MEIERVYGWKRAMEENWLEVISKFEEESNVIIESITLNRFTLVDGQENLLSINFNIRLKNRLF
jgi:hypothetical protein